ncbi:MAG: hypothetical protein IT582_01680 [Opitutaceae bacterium]|nr:hypothetical protein [Opitutaceae bacterium]
MTALADPAAETDLRARIAALRAEIARAEAKLPRARAAITARRETLIRLETRLALGSPRSALAAHAQ